jgi:hypothetical protein
LAGVELFDVAAARGGRGVSETATLQAPIRSTMMAGLTAAADA